jgi:hypothetical protein
VKRQDRSNKGRRHLRIPVKWPIKYWETSGSCHGGFIGDLSEKGVLLYSVHQMLIGAELKVRVLFYDGHQFDAFDALGKVVWKDLHRETDWEGQKYGLEFQHLSDEDRCKLVRLIDRLSHYASSPVPWGPHAAT